MVVRSRAGRLLPPTGVHTWEAPAAAIDFLKLLDKMDWHAAPPRHFMRELLGLRVAPDPDGPGHAEGFNRLMPMLWRIGRWIEAADAAQFSRLMAEMHTVLDWLDLDADGRAKAESGRPDWAMLVARANQWCEDREQVVASVQEWPVPNCDVVIVGHRVAWICSAAALMAEGRRMRHCAFDWLAACVSKQVALGSVLRCSDGRHVATLMVQSTGQGWRLRQISGAANRKLPLDVRVGSPDSAINLPSGRCSVAEDVDADSDLSRLPNRE